MASISNNAWALVWTGLVATGVGVWLGKRTADGKREPLNTYARIALAASALLLITGAAFLRRSLDGVAEVGHKVAALVFFVVIVLVVIINAIDFARQNTGDVSIRRTTTNRYGLVAWAMVLSFIVLFASQGWWDQWFFWFEAALILEFGAFSTLQTYELEGRVARSSAVRSKQSTRP